MDDDIGAAEEDQDNNDHGGDDDGDGPPPSEGRPGGDINPDEPDAEYQDQEDPDRDQDTTGAPSRKSKGQHPKEKVKISYERYQAVSQAIQLHLRSRENRGESEGMTRKAIVDWYLSLQSEISGEEELVQEAKLIRSVIKHMQKKDGLLVYVNGDENAEGDALLALHPNVAM